MSFVTVVGPALVIVGLLSALLYQRRLIHRHREIADRIRTEKEAVVALMDNIGERMTKKIDLDATLETILQFVVSSTHAGSGAIFLFNGDEQTLHARVVLGTFPPIFGDEELTTALKHQYLVDKVRQYPVNATEGIIGLTLTSDKPLLITDAEADPRVPRHVTEGFEMHSLVMCRLRVRGRNLGALALVNKQGEAVFDAQDTILLQALTDQAAITVDLVKLYDVLAQQQKIEQELALAHEFQRMLLPKTLPEFAGWEFAARCETALVVGGDFYDLFPIDRNRVGVVIGDVAGKGIPGALIMAMVRSVLRAEAREAPSPKEALRRANERMVADTKDNVFVTIMYGVLDLRNRRFRFARAGHEPLLIHQGDSPDGVRVVQPAGMAVGMVPGDIFDVIEEAEVQLHEGDSILLYTDGVVEALNTKSEEYGRERLLRVFAQNASVSPTALLELLTKDIEGFSQHTPQHDDITMVAFRVAPHAAEQPVPQAEEESSHDAPPDHASARSA